MKSTLYGPEKAVDVKTLTLPELLELERENTNTLLGVIAAHEVCFRLRAASKQTQEPENAKKGVEKAVPRKTGRPDK